MIRFTPLVWKQVIRHRLRTTLTILGVATGMFLHATVASLDQGVRAATSASARDNLLVVYRENRFCPFTSRLPEDYDRRLRAVPGVADVVPMRIVVSNCRASLDVVTYRGVRKEEFSVGEARKFRILDGSLDAWLLRSDAALVGATLAERRGFRVGDRFDSSGLTVTVAAIFESPEPQDRNVAYVDLPFLQRAPGARQEGKVTQFNVRVDDPSRMDEVARAIDAEFASAEEPTSTRSEKAFVARAAGDVMELVGFTRWVALGGLLAVLGLVANTIVLSVQDRVRDFGVLQTLGYTGGLLARLVVMEGVLLSLLGGLLGVGASVLLVSLSSFSLSNEGLSIDLVAGPAVWIGGLGASLLLGVLAGAVPAWRASRIPIASTFRAV
jgi:putative ABC transport system permease protein